MQNPSPLRQCNLRKHLVELNPKPPGQIVQLRSIDSRAITTLGLSLALLLEQ